MVCVTLNIAKLGVKAGNPLNINTTSVGVFRAALLPPTSQGPLKKVVFDS